jgi:hypothetical protein
MDSTKVSSTKHCAKSDSSNSVARNDNNNQHIILKVSKVRNTHMDDELDWGTMAMPTEKKVIFNQNANPYLINISSNYDEEDDESENAELLDIDTIRDLSDLDILKKSAIVARDLKFQVMRKYNANENETIDWILESIYWVKQNMEILSKRISQLYPDCDKNDDNNSDQECNEKELETICRNSYKFCDFGHTCTFNYSLSEKRDCYSQHFVYPLVLSDIQNLIDHIVMDDGITNDNILIKEVVTSINTITYVINHMFNEIDALKKENNVGYTYYQERKLNLKCITKNSKKRYKRKKY